MAKEGDCGDRLGRRCLSRFACGHDEHCESPALQSDSMPESAPSVNGFIERISGP